MLKISVVTGLDQNCHALREALKGFNISITRMTLNDFKTSRLQRQNDDVIILDMSCEATVASDELIDELADMDNVLFDELSEIESSREYRTALVKRISSKIAKLSGDDIVDSGNHGNGFTWLVCSGAGAIEELKFFVSNVIPKDGERIFFISDRNEQQVQPLLGMLRSAGAKVPVVACKGELLLNSNVFYIIFRGTRIDQKSTLSTLSMTQIDLADQSSIDDFYQQTLSALCKIYGSESIGLIVLSGHSTEGLRKIGSFGKGIHRTLVLTKQQCVVSGLVECVHQSGLSFQALRIDEIVHEVTKASFKGSELKCGT